MQFAATHPLNKIRRVQIQQHQAVPGDGAGQNPAGDRRQLCIRRADLPQRPVRLLPPEGRRRGVRRAGLPRVGHGMGPTRRTMPWSGAL